MFIGWVFFQAKIRTSTDCC